MWAIMVYLIVSNMYFLFGDRDMTNNSIFKITPIEFEKYCTKILVGYAEKEGLCDFTITHNKKIQVHDGEYQIDIYAEFVALGARFKVLCECKRYKSNISREKVSLLHDKLVSTGAQKGILLSTSDFQSGAIEYAKIHGIALIKVEDYHFEYISHSSGCDEYDENDPFCYAESHMPPYVAFEYCADTNEPLKVYPTKKMIKCLLIEEAQKLKEVLGIEEPIEHILEED